MSVPPSALHFAGNQPVTPNTGGNRGSGGIRATMRNTISHVPTAAHDKFVQVRLKPLLPLILAASALTFHEGQQKKVAEEGNSEAPASSWQSIVAESAIGYYLLKHTAGVYPLLGLGLAISRASKENNALDQLKAVITTAVTMGMGFLGANLLDPELMEKLENDKITKLFETEGEAGSKLTRWMDALKGQESEHVQDLGTHLRSLKDEIRKLPELIGKKHPNDKAALQQLKERIDELKAQVASKLDEPGVAQHALDSAESHGTKDTAEALMKRIAEGQSGLTKVTRTINPICCFMFSAFLIGGPLANWINGHLEHQRPDLKKKAMKQALFPDSQRVLKHSEEKGHKTVHSYQVNPGPYISCPAVGDGRPMQ